MNNAQPGRRLSIAVLLLCISTCIATPADAQKGPAQIAYAYAHQPTTESYAPASLYSYNSEGPITVTRYGVGFYVVEFVGLSALRDDQLGGYGNVQVSARGADDAVCLMSNLSANANVIVQVECFDPVNLGLRKDAEFGVLVTFPGSNPVSLAYLQADEPSLASYTAFRRFAYNSEKKDITISRSSVGVYAVTLEGFAPAVATNGGHVQTTPFELLGDPANLSTCPVGGWFVSGDDVIVNVRCFSEGSPADRKFSLLFVSDNSDVGNLAFAWANQATSASYTPSSFYSHNDAAGSVLASRASPGVYGMSFGDFATLTDGAIGGGGVTLVSPYASTGAPYCSSALSFGVVNTPVGVRCGAGFGGSTDPTADVPYNLLLIVRDEVEKEAGILNFDSYVDDQIVTTVSGEPITFVGGVQVETCNWSASCGRAWSGDNVVRTQLVPPNEFNREPLVMEFSVPQTQVSLLMNGFGQNGIVANVTIVAKDISGNVVATMSEIVTAAPSWEDKQAITVKGPATIRRVEVTSTGAAANWFYVDDISYTDAELPLELVSFDALGDGDEVVLRWKTLNEVDLSGFVVEELVEGQYVSASDLILSKGTGDRSANYEYRVKNQLHRSKSFRLRMIDLDGTVDYSDLLEVEAIGDVAHASAVYPNPAADVAMIQLYGDENQTMAVSVYDVTGRRVWSQDVPLGSGVVEEVRLPSQSLPSGVYLLVAEGKHFAERRTFVVAH